MLVLLKAAVVHDLVLNQLVFIELRVVQVADEIELVFFLLLLWFVQLLHELGSALVVQTRNELANALALLFLCFKVHYSQGTADLKTVVQVLSNLYAVASQQQSAELGSIVS